MRYQKKKKNEKEKKEKRKGTGNSRTHNTHVHIMAFAFAGNNSVDVFLRLSFISRFVKQDRLIKCANVDGMTELLFYPVILASSRVFLRAPSYPHLWVVGAQ